MENEPFNIIYEGKFDKNGKLQYAIEYKSTGYLSVYINNKITLWLQKEDVPSASQFIEFFKALITRLEFTRISDEKV